MRPIIRRRTMAGASPSLPYDAEVEWLGANGTQWIETDFIPLLGDTIHAEFLFNANIFSGDEWSVFSAGNGTYRTEITYVRNADGANHRGFKFKYFSDTQVALANTSAPNSWGTLDITSEGKATFQLSSSTLTVTSSPVDELDGTNNYLWLFRQHGSTKAFNGKIKIFYVVRNGQKVLELIPVRKGTTGYVYNTVSGKLHGNPGTGAFTYGNDVISGGGTNSL